MKLIPAPDTDYLFQRLTDEDGKIEMGVYPVMFGYRVQAGYIGTGWYHLDWCGGSEQRTVEVLYSICRTILEKRSVESAFKGVPTSSRKKPYTQDEDFVLAVVALSGEVEVEELPTLSILRAKLMKQFSAEKEAFLQNLFEDRL